MNGWSRALCICCWFGAAESAATAEFQHHLPSLERSYWIHASLAPSPLRGYWGPDYPESSAPTQQEVEHAARLLSDQYRATRLYLVYHHEMSLDKAERVFRWWRQSVPDSVQLVPTLVLRMYDKEQTPVFEPNELSRLVGFYRREIHDSQLGVYDVYPNRDQGQSLTYLAQQYPQGLIRIGIQPEEMLDTPFVAAVQDTWSGLCHGKSTSDWQDRGFGAETLQRWVEQRNDQQRNDQQRPVTWDLIVVAWDYETTERGAYPGYDDAAKNMALPAHRNALAAELILRTAHRGCLGGFSSDLLILQANSQDPAHDGSKSSFYQSLKRGEAYGGYYAQPLQEIIDIYRNLQAGSLRDGKSPTFPSERNDK